MNQPPCHPRTSSRPVSADRLKAADADAAAFLEADFSPEEILWFKSLLFVSDGRVREALGALEPPLQGYFEEQAHQNSSPVAEFMRFLAYHLVSVKEPEYFRMKNGQRVTLDDIQLFAAGRTR